MIFSLVIKGHDKKPQGTVDSLIGVKKVDGLISEL